LNRREVTDEFAELDAQLLQASAQAEATLADLLNIESRLARIKQVPTGTDRGDPAHPGPTG